MKILPLILTTLSFPITAQAALITFDGFSGGTSFTFDGDGDSIGDVIFSTSDPSGFNGFGPGIGQPFIGEPGIEGTVDLTPDLNVDFIHGAVGMIEFGFAVLDPNTNLIFRVFDDSDSLLLDQTFISTNVGGAFEGGLFSGSFAGVAARAEIDFVNPAGGRYIIDNFSGTFGSSDVIVPNPGSAVPEPSAAMVLLGCCLSGLAVRRRG